MKRHGGSAAQRSCGPPGAVGAFAVLGPLLVLAAWELSGLDMPVMRLFGNSQGFPWREHPLTRGLIHDGGRWLAGVVLVLLAWAAARTSRIQHSVGQQSAKPSASERWWTLSCVVLCLLLVPAFKRWSLTSCPWSLEEFGGQALWISHWWPGVADGGPGACFPSGHAVAAFGFLPQAVLWWRYSPRRAAVWLAGIVVTGMVFALAQTARGAHFPSHSLWSAVLCWLTALLWVGWWRPGRAQPTAEERSSERATASATSMPSTPADMMPPA